MPLSETALRRALWGFLIVVIAGVSAAGAWSLLRKPEAAAARLPVYGRVPGFSLQDSGGRRVEAGDLRGTVWVANFIYTRCTDTCPLQSAEMARLQVEFGNAKDLRLVSITVDPIRDTPAVLGQYARRFGAHPGRWLFLTGGREAILSLAREGFRLAVAEPPPGGAGGPLERAFPPETSEGAQGRGRAGARSSHGRGWLRAAGVALANGAVRWGIGPRVALAHDAAPAGPILHSARFALVDRSLRIRGYYESEDAEALGRLRRDLRALLREPASPSEPEPGTEAQGSPKGGA